MESKIINVGLYGGKGLFKGGREKPLEASIIHCDKYDKCSYYKNNQCLNVRAPFSRRCKYGKIERVTGYTSRAKKYYEFKSKWEKHEQYSKLKYPPEKLGLIDNKVVFPYPHIQIEENKDGTLKLESPNIFLDELFFVDYDKFTIDFINELCNFKPQAMMGGTILKYQQKVIPLFLTHLKEIIPNRFEELRTAYPELIKGIDYTGRKALLRTLNPCKLYYENSRYPQFDNEWYWDGKELIYKEGYISDFDIADNYEISEIKLKPTDKTVIEITDNSQVSENTIFVD